MTMDKYDSHAANTGRQSGHAAITFHIQQNYIAKTYIPTLNILTSHAVA